MVECIICLEEIEDEYAVIHNVNEVNKLHPECIQKWTEHSSIGIITRDTITNYSVFRNDRYVKTVTIPQNQKRITVEDETLTFREILNNIIRGQDDSQNDSFGSSNEFDSIYGFDPEDDGEMTLLSVLLIFLKLCFCLELE